MHPGRNNKGHDWHAGIQNGLQSGISYSNKTNNHHSLSSSNNNLLTNSIYESYLLNPINFLNPRNIFFNIVLVKVIISILIKHKLLFFCLKFKSHFMIFLILERITNFLKW
ncbi:hypothetical protein EDEG_02271 [Edhazardia aedis USNM 41457]|uniref:Uncharacterized protein n=1 Tax=Edhazardia aedis (strain USNM 41457) TaxID=1003232 RepID=J9D7A9_EDHAE|nr:hypothetical protein EDEG_02271 [Edhazardia aedis USNM 41457]|eukprot:EJW03414.1 hypothetical protein EDEG_02271 [Edhazardia aedis USNM 41457]